MAVAPLREPRASASSGAPASTKAAAAKNAETASLREIVWPCARIAFFGLLAVGYLMLSARVSDLETQRTALQRRIDAEQARYRSMYAEYQEVANDASLHQYAAAAKLQPKPAGYQSIDVPSLPPRELGLVARLERRQPGNMAMAAPPAGPARVVASLAP